MVRNVFGLDRRGVLPAIFALAAITAVSLAPAWFSTSAVSIKGSGLNSKTQSHNAELPNYDIRSDKSAYQKLAAFRDSSGANAAAVADLGQSFVVGEDALRSRVPTLKIEYNTDIRIPEVIGPDVSRGKAFLTEAGNEKRSNKLKSFLKENNELVGVADAEIESLKVFSD